MVVVFLIDTGQAVFNPTYTSLLPQLVGRQDLPGAMSLHSAQMNTSRVVGLPVLGASLDSTFGAPAVFIVSGVSFLFVIAALLSVRLPAPVLNPDEPRVFAGSPPGSWWPGTSSWCAGC
ncbi:MAG TPA: MFS transporter [Acidimicrobiales bacterium]|nr:MFS transporter [Acidimicrobiales bacterium]